MPCSSDSPLTNHTHLTHMLQGMQRKAHELRSRVVSRYRETSRDNREARGLLSREEWIASTPAGMQPQDSAAAFDRLDRNGDGVLSYFELEQEYHRGKYPRCLSWLSPVGTRPGFFTVDRPESFWKLLWSGRIGITTSG